MAEHPIESIMSTALENIKKMIDVNTIIGNPVTTPDGTVIIPVSKVAFGFCAGGSEFGAPSVSTPDGNAKFGGGSGAGVSITPVAFLVVNGTNVRLISMTSASTTTDKIVDMIPDVLDKFSELVSGSKKEKKIKFQDEIDME
ncbi:MAG: sporulation protein YtfJ [Ruminococcaceae bacterium]|nr:sporulation protein YtfJ [Oscillospiraceae bacterium]